MFAVLTDSARDSGPSEETPGDLSGLEWQSNVTGRPPRTGHPGVGGEGILADSQGYTRTPVASRVWLVQGAPVWASLD